MKRLLWCSLLLLLIACKDSGKASCDNVTRFLEFYAKNYDKIYADEGFDYAPKYRVNFNKVAQLAQRLELETYFTDNFRQTFQERYQKADQQLRFQPQSDGPIDGFEADAFLKTQDVDAVLDAVGKGDFKCTASGSAVAVAFPFGHTLVFEMEDGKIDQIDLKQ